MLQYQKKKGIVNVVGQFDGVNMLEGMDFDMGGAFIRMPPSGNRQYILPTDWILPAGDNYHYIMSDIDFKATYEPVTNNINNMEDKEKEKQAPIGDRNSPMGGSIATGRALTDGEKAAGVDFNPSNIPDVDEVKALTAQLLYKIMALRRASSGDKARYYSKAISYIEDGQMNAVKGITWRY